MRPAFGEASIKRRQRPLPLRLAFEGEPGFASRSLSSKLRRPGAIPILQT
jgi:hypothetical protein